MGTISAVARGLRSLTPAEITDARAGKADIVELLQSKGVAIAAAPRPFMVNAALLQNSMSDTSRLLVAAVGLGLAALGLVIGLARVTPARRARNGVERVMLIGLGAASMVAILTTAGIVLSMLFETLHFFSHVSPLDFFFGTVWDPRFSAAGAEWWRGGPVRSAAAAVGHRLHFHRGALGCRSGRIVLGDLHVGVRQQERARQSSSRCSKSWPASRPSSTASSRSSPSGRSSAT